MEIKLEDIELPHTSKLIVSVLIQRGGICRQLPKTDLYIVTIRDKEYFFSGDFNPLIPYMYGVTLLNKYYWFNFLKTKHLNFRPVIFKPVEKLTLFMTSTYEHNAVLFRKIKVTGNGKLTLQQLISNENMQRINSPVKSLFPIFSKMQKVTLGRIIAQGRKIVIPGNVDYEEVTERINPFFIILARRIIDSLPGLPYICFELSTSDLSQKSCYYIGNILMSGGINLFFNLKCGKLYRNAAEIIANKIMSLD
jgi:hypothetical protein